MKGWEIQVRGIWPPVPSRAFDYIASFEGQEELGSGFGSTPEEAVVDLIERDMVMWVCESPRCNAWNGINDKR